MFNFFESSSWNWKDDKQFEVQEQKNNTNDEHVKGTKTLSYIYQRYNVAVIEPTDYKEAIIDQKWIAAMKKELKMIKKNQTQELVDKPQQKKKLQKSSEFIEPN